MADRLGIITPYTQHERTRAAITLADLAYQEGTDVSIFAIGACHRSVSPFWDSRIIHCSSSGLMEWLCDKDSILWTAPPMLELAALCKANGVVTAYLPLWEDLQPEHYELTQYCDVMLLPHCCVAESICRMWGGDSYLPVLMPWDVQQPVTAPRLPLPERLEVFVPMYDAQNARVRIEVFDMLYEVIGACPHAHFTIGIGTGWSMQALEIARRLCKELPYQTTIVRRPDEHTRTQLISRSQLVIQPATYDCLGSIGLEAILLGVPVCAWNIPPNDEYLHDGENALLVHCNRLQPTWLGLGIADDDYTVFGAELVALLHDREFLAKITSNVSVGLRDRKTRFLAGWQTYRDQ